MEHCYEDTLPSFGTSAISAGAPTSIRRTGTPLLRDRPAALACAAHPSQWNRLSADGRL